MKDITFGAAREIAAGKAGIDDNSESGMLFFVPPIRGSHSLLSSEFLCTNSGSIFISIEFLFNTYNYVLFTYHYCSVLLGIQMSHCCILQEAHMGYQIMFLVWQSPT